MDGEPAFRIGNRRLGPTGADFRIISKKKEPIIDSCPTLVDVLLKDSTEGEDRDHDILHRPAF